MEAKDYTQDGSVDFRGRPALASRTGRWRACSFLVGYESFERMAFYGVASNLVVYLTTQLHEDTVSSVRNVNNWTGSVWITPFLGAYIADAYLGRFWTFTISSLIYLTGMILLTMAVSLKSFHPTCSNGVCGKATPPQVAFFYTALYVMAIGAGGTKPNISTFGADQFDDFDPHEKKLKASFFNWWMFSSFLGGLMATLGLVYIQENLGWGLGYAIPTVGLMVSLVIFYVGTPNYRHKVRKTKRPGSEMARVLVAAVKNRGLELPEDPKELFELEPQHYMATGKRRVHHTSAFRFLDKAAMRSSSASSSPCTVTQVEETKQVVGMFLVWLTTLIPSTIWAQVNTLFVKQGTTLDRSLGPGAFRIPAASLGSFVTLSMLLTVPLYDRYFVPLLRARTGHPNGITLLQRLGIGFVFQTLVAAVAYLVELKRMHVIAASGRAFGPADVVPMSIFWLLPQYVLLGVGNVFIAIGQLEFFYEQSPEGTQSLGTTFFTSAIGMGNFLNSLMVTVVVRVTGRRGGKSWIGDNLNDSHLDYYYAFVMALSVANMAAFLWVARGYSYKKETMEGVAAEEGKVVSDVGVQLTEGKKTQSSSLDLRV